MNIHLCVLNATRTALDHAATLSISTCTVLKSSAALIVYVYDRAIISVLLLHNECKQHACLSCVYYTMTFEGGVMPG